jgi:hypothetical protein
MQMRRIFLVGPVKTACIENMGEMGSFGIFMSGGIAPNGIAIRPPRSG